MRTDNSLTGQLLVAMPTMADPRFARSVIYLCAHSAEGAMGLVVNRLIESLTFPSLLILLISSLLLSACGAAPPTVIPTTGPQAETLQPVIYAPALAQDLIVRFYTGALLGYDPSRSFYAYLHVCARHAVIDWRRREPASPPATVRQPRPAVIL